MKSILVTTDGSENSKRALVAAKRFAESMDSKVTIINSAAHLPAYVQGAYVDSIKKSTIENQDKILEEALKVFQDYSGKVDVIREKGEAGEMILKEAEKGDYDLIIMGSRGLGGFSKVVLGSVSNKVLNYIKNNVLIIK